MCGVYIINLDEDESIRTDWIPLYMNVENVIYFDIFGSKHISIEIRKFVGKKSII